MRKLRVYLNGWAAAPRKSPPPYLIATVLFCLFWPGAAQAEWWGGGHREKRHEKFEQAIQEAYDQLGLSQEQRSLLQENKRRYKESMSGINQQLKSAMDEVGEELKQKEPDYNKITSIQHSRIKELRGRLFEERFNSILQVRRILTQEQFAKFSEILQERKRAFSKNTP